MRKSNTLWKYSIGDVGLEVEFTSINRNNVEFVESMNRRGIKVVHDASNETPRLSINNLLIGARPGSEEFNFLVSKLNLKHSVAGGELVSDIYTVSSSDWKSEVYTVAGLLSKFGETEVCTRDSLHVHVNVGHAVELETIHRLLRMSMAYEYIFYKLGGMGCENRGVHNSFIYQRPYTPKGPPVVYYSGRCYPIFYVEHLLQTKDKTEFFNAYGDSVYQSEHGGKYVTQRYMGINFYSLITQGSLEFRHANKTLNPEWIIAWAELCSAFVKKAFFQDVDDTELIKRPLTMGGVSDADFADVLNSFAFLSIESRETLYGLWNQCEDIKYEDVWTLSHLKDPTFYSNHSNRPGVLPKDIVVDSATIYDVHKLSKDFSRHYNNVKKNYIDVDEFRVMFDREHRDDDMLEYYVRMVNKSVAANIPIDLLDKLDLHVCDRYKVFIHDDLCKELDFVDAYMYIVCNEDRDDDDETYLYGEIVLYAETLALTYTGSLEFDSRDENLVYDFRSIFEEFSLIIKHEIPNTLSVRNDDGVII